MVRKDKVIEFYLKNRSLSVEESAYRLSISKSQYSIIVSAFIKSLNIGKDIGFCFSFSFPQNLGYLFDDYREREVLIEDNEILNKSDFTEYELMWLLENYGLGDYNKTEKADYLKIAKEEIKQNLLQIKTSKKAVAYLETI